MRQLPDLSKYKYIITDVDGTLYSQMPLRIHMGLWMIYKAPGVVGELLSFRKQREKGELVEPSDRVREWMYVRPLSVIARYKYKELTELLSEAREAGKRLIAYSDYPAKDKLRALGVECDAIYDPTNENIKVLKPNPEGLEYILSELGARTNEEDGMRTDGIRTDGIRKSDILYIGDRAEKDGLCAQKVGVDFYLWK